MDFTFGYDPFPVGTSIEVYEDRGQVPSGAPQGSVAIPSVTVPASSLLALIDLEPDTRYFAVAQVAGEWRWVKFATDELVPPEFDQDTADRLDDFDVRIGVLESGGAAFSGPGYGVPAGSLDRFIAAKASMDISLLEIVVPGDSTTKGETGGTGHPWTQTLRALMVADGWPDGGRGIVNGGGVEFSGDEAIAGILASTATGTQYQFGILKTSMETSNALDEHTEFQGKGTRARLWVTAYGSASSAVAVSIDGGAEANFEPSTSVVNNVELLALGSEGTHTVDVRNLAGRKLVAPVVTSSLFNASPGNTVLEERRYKVTLKTSSGETLPSNVVTQTPPNSTNDGVTLDSSGYEAWGNVFRVYVSTDAGVTYDLLVDDLAPLGNGNLHFNDDGSYTPNGAIHPPVVDGSGYSGPAETNFALEFIRDAGFVIHNHGIPSITGAGYLNGAAYPGALDANVDPSVRAIYGLDREDATNPPDLADTDPAGRSVALAIVHLGINDQQGPTDPDDYEGALRTHCQLARAAGADPLIVKPHLEAANNVDEIGAYRAALTNAINAEQCAWVDFGSGGALGPFSEWATLGYGGAGANPHLTALAYDVQAQFLWDSILSRV